MSDFDLIVIGSGFGGAMAAMPAVRAGKRVLMIERGDRVPRGPENWGANGFFTLTSAYTSGAQYEVTADTGRSELGSIACVGGASVFYGGVALRLRERDFEPDPDLDGDSGAAWPYSYQELEPYYARVEEMLGVAGQVDVDPTEPPRSTGYPQRPQTLAPISARIADVARGLGLTPFPLPLAINYNGTRSGGGACALCGTCDGFACAVSAKNDIATAIIPELERLGMVVAPNTVVVRLVDGQGRIKEVECVDGRTLTPCRFRGRAVVLAAGSLATPHILLSSGLEGRNPAGASIGRYLMRHCNAVLMGIFSKKPVPDGGFHKQIGIQDFYFGHPSVREPRGKLGCIQQFATPQAAYMVSHAEGWILKRYEGFRRRLALSVAPWVVPMGVPHITGFIVIAEDRPLATNRVKLAGRTKFGTPGAAIDHHYDARDLAARNALVGAAQKILKGAGSVYSMRDDIQTFSHAVGTVRLGVDSSTAPLDAWGAFRGIDNLWVADGSVLPRSGGVNPSLTIAANALRTGERVAASL